MQLQEARKSISLFYFFSLLDGQLAAEASVAIIKKKTLKEAQGESDTVEASTLIHLMHKVWMKYKDKKMIQSSGNIVEAGWVFSEGVDVGLWRQFVKESEPDEYLTLLWAKILNYKDEDIAQGLGVTVGTIRHRTGRALRRLGLIKAKNQL